MTQRIAIIGSQDATGSESSTKLDLLPDGTLKVSLGSHVKPGLYSHYIIPNAHMMTERELMRIAGVAIAFLADYQKRSFGDDHEYEQAFRSAVEGIHKMLKDGTPRVWVNRRLFHPGTTGVGPKTMDIANPTRPNWT